MPDSIDTRTPAQHATEPASSTPPSMPRLPPRVTAHVRPSRAAERMRAEGLIGPDLGVYEDDHVTMVVVVVPPTAEDLQRIADFEALS